MPTFEVKSPIARHKIHGGRPPRPSCRFPRGGDVGPVIKVMPPSVLGLQKSDTLLFSETTPRRRAVIAAPERLCFATLRSDRRTKLPGYRALFSEAVRTSADKLPKAQARGLNVACQHSSTEPQRPWHISDLHYIWHAVARDVREHHLAAAHAFGKSAERVPGLRDVSFAWLIGGGSRRSQLLCRRKAF